MEFLGLAFEPRMLDYGSFQHSDDKMHLWLDENMVASLKKGMIDPSLCDRWKDDELLLQAYQNHAKAQELNCALGFD